MKTIDKLIIEKYNDEQKRNIKNKIGIVSQEHVVRESRFKTILFIPSIISLCFSLVLMFISTILFINSLPQNPQNSLNPAEKHLKASTVDYIKSPIETKVMIDSDTVIAIYYGVVGDAKTEVNNFLVFEIVSKKEVLINTKITNENETLYDNEFMYNLQENNFFSFTSNKEFLDVTFIIEKIETNLVLDLTEYYNFLTK